MADYGAIADAIAARFLGTTPPTGQPAIRLSTADIPNGITVTPCFLVFEPDDEWADDLPLGRGRLTFPCRLFLPQSDEPRTQRLMLNWRTALHTRLDGWAQMAGAISGVQWVRVTKTTSGTFTYAGADYPVIEVTVVVKIGEARTVAG